MLPESKLKQIKDFADGFTRDELIWVNGYLAALLQNGNGHTVPAANGHAMTATKKISLVYGTETGNAKRLATQLAAAGKKNGINVKLAGLDQYRLTDLEKEEYFFVVISTQGEGEPPIPAKKFYDYIHEKELKLPKMKFGVLALGDSSYPLFCKTGEDVHQQLEKFGAAPVVPLVKCDVEYEADAQQWFEQIIKLTQATQQLNAATVVPATEQATAKKPTGKKYYKGTILTNINLNDRGSNKRTNHIEIGTEEPIVYEPGDTIGIVPKNRSEVVEKIISLTGIDGAKEIATAKATGTVKDLLTNNLGICYLMTNTIKKYAAITEQVIPDTRMDLADLLRIYPVKDAAQFEEVLKILISLAPRLYSVSSSPAAHGETEVHITVALDTFLAEDEQKFGLCSEYLGDLPVGTELSFYVHKDKHFKLPAGDKDVIMIGPGTGIAPFRSFISERDASGATGRNWLFFGEQHFITDFLYQTEMQNFLDTGVLQKLSLAFSRDQQEKIYVQHRILQQADELYQWLSNGASLYISGKKDPMSVDVEDALIQVICEKGNKTTEEARAWLENMKKEGRYAKDVY